MRISDWSSDVCSSDLKQRLDACLPHALAHGRQAPMIFGDFEGLFVGCVPGISHRAPPSMRRGGHLTAPLLFWIQFQLKSWIQFGCSEPYRRKISLSIIR